MSESSIRRVYVAYVNVPGYMSNADTPYSAETPEECWEWLAHERDRDLDAVDEVYVDRANQGEADMMRLMATGEYPADWIISRTGTIRALTPGYTGDHDLGLCYTVREVYHACQLSPTCEACEHIDSWEE